MARRSQAGAGQQSDDYGSAFRISSGPAPGTAELVTTDEVLTEVLTNDRHFEQDGFKAAFRQS